MISAVSDPWALATIFIGGIATLAIFSFLIAENRFYRLFEHIFIGIAAGFLPIYSVKNTLWPNILMPMLGLNIHHYPDGTTSAPYNPWWLLYLVPLAFGLLYYCIYSRRFGWLAKLVIGFSLGASAGLSFKGFFAEMTPQIVGSFKPLLVYRDPLLQFGETTRMLDYFASFSNTVFVVTLLMVLYYFIFSFRHEGKTARAVSGSGRWLMMICFGAFFGSTVMARMALLVERLQFVLVDWRDALGTLAGIFFSSNV